MMRPVGVALTTLMVACGGSRAEPPAPRAPPLAAPPAESAATTASSPPPTTSPPLETSPPDDSAPLEPPPVTPAELPRGTTILHIGDSFAGALGIDLNRELKAVGVRGILRYETATYIPTWAFGKQIDLYLGRWNPDLVIVTLGANELMIPDPAARAPTIRKLVSRLGGRPCVWVGPPLWKGARPALLDTIRSECAPCVYLDSNALVPDLPRARDHIHPSIDARKIWAKAVVDWLAGHRAGSAGRPWGLTQ